MMEGFGQFLSDPRSAALAVNLALPSTVILGTARLLVKAASPRSAALRRSLFLAALLCALLAPAVGFALHRSGLHWTLSPAGLEAGGAPLSGTPARTETPVPIDGAIPPLFPEDRGTSPAGATLDHLLEPGGGANDPGAEETHRAGPSRAHVASPLAYLVKGLNLFLCLWGAGTLVLLLRLVRGWRCIARFRRGLARITDPRVTGIVQDLAKRYGLRPAPPVFASEGIASPLTLGPLRPCMVLPEPLIHRLDDAELKAVLSHEFAHLSHGDLCIGHLQRLAAAIYWWNPFVHAANVHLAAAMEEVCDNHAIHETREIRRYAACLVHLAERTRRVTRIPGTAGMGQRRKTLEARVKALLSEDRNMETAMRRSAAGVLIAGSLLVTGLAAIPRIAFTQEAKAAARPGAVEAAVQEGAGEKGRAGKALRRIKSGGAAQKAVKEALDWLKRHQDPAGYWDCDGFDRRCVGKPCDGKGMALNDVGVTGLALLAFLGAGNTPMEGPYKETVAKGIQYLCQSQDPEDGCLTPKESPHYMYNHGVASLALVEAYGLSGMPVLKKHAERAVEFIHETKNPGKAWRYNRGDVDPTEQNDVSVTGWMVMCLASAKDFDLPVETKDIEDALLYIHSMTDPVTGRTGYKEQGSYSSREAGDELIWPFDAVEAMTAVGMLCRIFCGNLLGKIEAERPMLEKGAALLRAKPPRWDPKAGTIDYYYWYYGSYAMFQMGGDDWKTWKDAMVKALVEHQGEEGCEHGSWPPQYDPWGDHGGRVYSTALGALCLEVFYRYENLLVGRKPAEGVEPGVEPQEKTKEATRPTPGTRDVIGIGAARGSTAGLFKGKYRHRLAKTGRLPVQNAVERGLDWLKRHQDPAGYWDCDGFDRRCVGKPCDGKGMALNDVGVTGLALLAFQGAGYTLFEGPYRDVVKRGLYYLCAVQDPSDGCLTPKESQHYMYNHGIAALALIEGYGLSGSPVLKKHAKRAVEFIHRTKNPRKAWRYNRGSEDPVAANDMSVTAWMVLCLCAARDFGLPYDEDDLADALKYIDELTDMKTGRTGYTAKGSYSSREAGDELIWPFNTTEALTGAGMLCRIFICNALGDMVSQTEALQKGAKLLLAKPPNWDPNAGTIDYCYWYYGSYALFQMGGEYWKAWKEPMVKSLVEHQRADGHAKGSWDPQYDPWGDNGGRVYSTALCTLTLEAFYRYANILYAR